MPRRSTHNSEENPVPRRTSARIAAVQAASPAKSPVKSPRRKRKSTQPTSEDTESQQSQIKSEGSLEEINGLETSSSTKDRDSVADSQELPPKKPKTDEQTNDVEAVEQKPDEVTTEEQPRQPDDSVVPTSTEVADFEVVEKADVPAPDSAEVEAAVSVQGEDGQLLVGFVQVDKEELPSATSLEVKVVATSEQPEACTIESKNDENSVSHPADTIPLNGSTNSTDDVIPPTDRLEPQAKVPHSVEAVVQPSQTPAAGDGTVVDSINSEAMAQ